MAGVTETGFVKKTTQTIISELVEAAKENFGDDFDLRQGTVQYQILSDFANQFATLWDSAELLYNNRRISMAENVELDYAVRAIGIRRNQALNATGEATFTGTNGVTIPLGFIIQTTAGIQFQTTESGVIASGTVTLNIQSSTTGASNNVAANTITGILNPLSGLTSVTNAAETTGGRDQETDEALRSRYFSSLALGGGPTSNAIRANLLQVDGVTDVVIRVNSTLTTDADGIPGKAFGPVVLGGTDNDIATSIFNTKSVGIQSFGTVTQDFTDDSGNTITIGFTRPTLQDVYIRATVTSSTDYPADGNTQVQNIIINHINGLGIGDDVILFRLSSLIGSGVTGITNLLIESSLDGTTYTQNDITITGINKAQTDAAKVSVL